LLIEGQRREEKVMGKRGGTNLDQIGKARNIKGTENGDKKKRNSAHGQTKMELRTSKCHSGQKMEEGFPNIITPTEGGKERKW